MKKAIIASAVALLAMSSTAFAVDAGSKSFGNNITVGNTSGTVKINTGMDGIDNLPAQTAFYGAVNIGATNQATNFRSMNLLPIELEFPNEDSSAVDPSAPVFYNVGLQYTPTFKYPEKVETLNIDASLTLDATITADIKNDQSEETLIKIYQLLAAAEL